MYGEIWNSKLWVSEIVFQGSVLHFLTFSVVKLYVKSDRLEITIMNAFMNNNNNRMQSK